jgi:hypothetical protein
MCDCGSQEDSRYVTIDGEECVQCKLCLKDSNEYMCTICGTDIEYIHDVSEDECDSQCDYCSCWNSVFNEYHQKKCTSCGDLYCRKHPIFGTDPITPTDCTLCSKCCGNEEKESGCYKCGIDIKQCHIHNSNYTVNCSQNFCKKCCLAEHGCILCGKICLRKTSSYSNAILNTFCHEHYHRICLKKKHKCLTCPKILSGKTLTKYKLGHCKSCSEKI